MFFFIEYARVYVRTCVYVSVMYHGVVMLMRYDECEEGSVAFGNDRTSNNRLRMCLIITIRKLTNITEAIG